MPEHSAPRLMSLAEAGAYLGVPTRTVRRLMNIGALRSVQLDQRERRVCVEDAEQFVQNLRAASPSIAEHVVAGAA